jgi:hypothetical protein
MAANYCETGIGCDTTFELNEFNEPRIRSEIETLKDALLFILFSKPGAYPSIPEIGLDIESYLYSFYDDIDEEVLKNQITEQCELLGAYIGGGTIQIQKTKYRGKPSLLIHIEGTEEYPSSYKHDNISSNDKYLIGITYDELNNMIYNINS